MEKKNPLEYLLDEINALLQKIQNHDKPIKDIPPETMKQLDNLMRSVAIFEAVNQQAYESANIDMNKLKLEAMQSAELSERQKKIFKFSANLERDAQAMANQLNEIIEKKKDPAIKEEKLKKKEARARAKKYKRLGDKGWIPL